MELCSQLRQEESCRCLCLPVSLFPTSPQCLGGSHSCLSYLGDQVPQAFGDSGVSSCYPLPSSGAPLGGTRLLLFGCLNSKAGLILPMGS